MISHPSRRAIVAMSLSVATVPAAAITPHQSAAVDAFRHACMEGQAKFAPGDVTPISGKDVPVYIRDYEATQYRTRTIYKLAILPETYLVTFSDAKFKDSYDSGCELVTEYMNSYQLWSSLTNMTSDAAEYRKAERYDMHKPSEGWDLSVRWLDTFAIDSHRYTIARIGLLTDKQRKDAPQDRTSFTPYKGPHIPSNAW